MGSVVPSLQPPRILSLDGGGVRCLSSLLILENIMERIRDTEHLAEIPKPCEMFDLIGGSGTGGRNGLQCEAATAHPSITVGRLFRYKTRAFYQKDNKRELPSIDMRETERDERAYNPYLPTRRYNIPRHIMHEDANVETLPTLFTTYDTSSSLSGSKIWEVARATSATATFFKSITVGRDEIEFIDASFGHNNPCESVIMEAEEQFPSREMVILSIGTGLGNVVKLDDTKDSVAAAQRDVTMSSKPTALRLKKKYKNTGGYYRFSVENGLRDIPLLDTDKMSTISAHTRNYLIENEDEIMEFVEVLASRAPPALRRPGETNGRQPVYFVPFYESRSFVGREQVLSTLSNKLFAQDGFQQVALVGLGGMGKTQVALKLAYWVKKNKPDHSVLWLTVTSMASFRNACKGLVERLKVRMTGDEDPRVLLKDYLESKESGKWLLILDNVDDIELFNGPTVQDRIAQYLPRNDAGRALFTTRSYQAACLAVQTRADIIKLEEMATHELTAILERGVEGQDDETQAQDKALINDLLQELCHLPLAVSQAADYMSMNQISISEYLQILRSTEEGKIGLLDDAHPDETHHDPSQSAVATTWLITFDKIRKSSETAVALLKFIAHVDSNAIPQSIFPEFGTKKQMTNAIGMLLGYGFLRRHQTPGIFDMHGLVHLAAQKWCKIQEGGNEEILAVLKHITLVFPEGRWEDRFLWRQYLAHALLVFEAGKAVSGDACDLAFKLATCLFEDGNNTQPIGILEHLVAYRKKTPIANDPLLEKSLCSLAVAYIDNGQVEKAVHKLSHMAKKGKGKPSVPTDHFSSPRCHRARPLPFYKLGAQLRTLTPSNIQQAWNYVHQTHVS
ncbi:Nephrocystin-3 [Ceratocystis lukuohia]|uniref:Nephrocystin-3 n=1 Tax=Ceratocystis lukuohia TaxID=2019550 RepID=A0ABR4MQ22_9PEZI